MVPKPKNIVSTLIIIYILHHRLIMTKVWIILLLISTVFLIFLEGRLFSVGTTVFGLISLLCLFLACLLIYFWVVVQSLYMRIEQAELAKVGLDYQRPPRQNGHANYG